MKVVAQRALYGDVNGGHDLIEPQTHPLALLRKLTRFTDRPGQLPPHIGWTPYLSGIPLDDCYILARTFPDPTASRAGMVLTHALIFGLEEAARMPDLTPALMALPNQPERKIDSNSVELVISDDAPLDTVPAGLTDVVHNLLEEDRNSRPVIWIGQEGFDEVIAALWRGLWPSVRRTFRFGFGFAPQDIEGQGMKVVATSEGVETRWAAYHQAGPLNRTRELTRAECYLLNQPEGEPLRTLLAHLETEPRTISDLKKVEACYGYLEGIRSNGADLDTGAVRMLTRLLGTLAPKASQGVAIKSEVFDLLLKMTERGTAADVKALRNFDAQPFVAGEDKIKTLVKSWIHRHILVTEPDKVRQNADLIQASLETATSPWGASVIDALREVLATWQQGAGRAVWQWWQIAPRLIAGSENFIPNVKRAEADLAKNCPIVLAAEMGEQLLVLAKRRRWYVLHGTTAMAICGPSEALRRQLQIDTDQSRYEGLRALASRMPAAELIKIALTAKEPRLLKIAGEACAQEPSLMAPLDVHNTEWRRIWLHAIEAGAPAVDTVNNPRESTDELIALLASGVAIEDELLMRVGQTPYADLTTHPQRTDAWEHMGAAVRELFLNTTADGWLQRFRVDSTFDLTLEDRLETEVLRQPRIARQITKTDSGNVPFLISLFRRFGRLKSQQFKELLDIALRSGQQISALDAVSLGKFIRDKGWRDCAKHITWYLENQQRQDLASAVRECQNLLGWIDSFRLKLTGRLEGLRIAEEDWWSALSETVAEIYPYGPDQDYIWERAGGDLSTVNRHQSGRAGWREALQSLRHGGGGKDITRRKLLKEMRRQYPNNHSLQLLQEWLDRR